jgi:hypothetical protein
VLASATFYAGVGLILIGLGLMIRPVRLVGISTRTRAAVVTVSGFLVGIAALQLPTIETRAATRSTRLDEVTPVWQFREFHSRRIAAPPAEVYAAMRRVRADDILWFQTLTWIRRGGREVPPSILNAGTDRPILDVALSSGFVLLADDSPREIVIGTVVDAPPGAARIRRAEIIRNPPPGYSVGTMNFRLVPDGTGTRVSTETRVFSNGRETTRRFARYWRVIYPGSAVIRRMWLRAIENGVTGLPDTGLPDTGLPDTGLPDTGLQRRRPFADLRAVFRAAFFAFGARFAVFRALPLAAFLALRFGAAARRVAFTVRRAAFVATGAVFVAALRAVDTAPRAAPVTVETALLAMSLTVPAAVDAAWAAPEATLLAVSVTMRVALPIAPPTTSTARERGSLPVFVSSTIRLLLVP